MDYNSYKQNLRHLKVLIWGLGISGGGVNIAKYFLTHGSEVRITDLKTETELAESIQELKGFENIQYTLGEHREKDFLWADLIIKNPAIPPSSKWNHFIEDNSLNVEMELNLFLKYFPGKVIGITGTRGKSTTTELIFQTLKESGMNVFTGGNNKQPLLLKLDNATEDQIAVVEMSSFQLYSTEISPNIAVVTNIYPDHLDWHEDIDDYINAKQNIVRFQKKEDYKILNTENATVEKHFVDCGKGQVVEVKKKNLSLSEDDMNLKGEHNLYNAELAVGVARILQISGEITSNVLEKFQTLQFRHQEIANIEGVRFINDSCSTTPEGLIAALERFKKEGRVLLIAGGVSKNLDLTRVAESIKSSVHKAFILDGTFYHSIKDLLATDIMKGPFSSLPEILNKIEKTTKPGDIVLFSPGAASFNMFENEWDRGRKFDQLVNELR